jgi:hypothetical protein
MPAVVTAIVATGGPAEEEPGEEDHRDDEDDAGHDGYPRQGLVEPAGPVVAVVGPRGRFTSGCRYFRHVSIILFAECADLCIRPTALRDGQHDDSIEAGKVELRGVNGQIEAWVRGY